MKIKFVFVIWILAFVIFAGGCDAFVRKFTRKRQKENLPQEEMVLAPEEYKPAPAEELYRHYLLYWKSWQDELIQSLLTNTSHKKRLDTVSEAINNLQELKKLLKENRRGKIEAYIQRLEGIKSSIESDIYGSNSTSLRLDAERLKLDILRDFSYNKAKNDLI